MAGGIASAVVLVAVVAVSGIVVWRLRKYKRGSKAQPAIGSRPDTIVDEYSIGLARGKYKWKEVAVKIYPLSYKHL